MSFRHHIAAGAVEVAAAQAALARWLAGLGATPRAVTRAEIVLEELALNAHRHGGAAEVLVEARIVGEVCSLVLEDAGLAFDPTAAADITPREARVGGHGLILVRRNAVAIRYGRTAAGRNRLEVDLPLS